MSRDVAGAPSATTISVDLSGRVDIVTRPGGPAVTPRRDRAVASTDR
jgi:hypothetical protein